MSLFVRCRSLLSHFKRRLKARRLDRTAFFKQFPAGDAALLRDSRTHVNKDRGFVYSRLPKAGNSTVISTLYSAEGNICERDVIETIKLGQRRPSEMDAAEIAMIREHFYIFTVVRNPYARLVSCYKDKIARPSLLRSMVSRRHLGEVDCEISLDEFLDFLDQEDNLLMYAHWAPQSRLLAFPIEDYHLIGSVETLEADLAEICASLGMDNATVNYIPHATGALKHLYALSPEQVSRIADIYTSDFHQFGYSRDIDRAQDAPSARVRLHQNPIQ